MHYILYKYCINILHSIYEDIIIMIYIQILCLYVCVCVCVCVSLCVCEIWVTAQY